MTWVQYRDADHKLADEFGVSAIPHYFTIDSDGVLTSEMMGSGSDVEGKLKKLIAKAEEAKEQAQVGAVWHRRCGGACLRKLGSGSGGCRNFASRIASKAETGLQSRYGEHRRLNQYSLNRVSARIHGSVC